MKMHKPIVLLIAFVALAPARADLRLSLTQTRTVVSGAAADRDSSEEQLCVVLGSTYFWIDLKDYRRIYDFKKERLYTLHRESKTYLNDSLQSLVAYREVEMRSRMGVGPFVPLENLSVGPDIQFELANLFGMTIEGMTVPDPVEEIEGRLHKFAHNGSLAVEYELRDAPMPEELRGSFAKFLAYEGSMHPLIRRKFASHGKLFQGVRMISHIGNSTRVTELALTDAAPVAPPAELIPADYTFGPEPGNNDPVLQVVCSVLNGAAKAPAITSADLRRQIDEALTKKQYAQAMVCYFQNMLQFGEEDVELLRKISDAAGDDKEFLLINVGIRRNSKAQAERAVMALDAIDCSKLTNGYVLDVYKADALSTAGRVAESKWLLVKTIQTNPYLAGAYKDLGGILFATFDMPGAWRCWELCLKLCPGYSLLKKFDHYQEQRRRRFPDFF